MIRDEDLKQAIDYSEGQKTAAYMVLGELVNLLNAYTDDMRIIGGWVPSLLYPNSGHIGSIDVDILLNHLKLGKAKSYETIKRILMKNGYKRHPKKHFTFVKTVMVQDLPYVVDVDFLSGMYGGDSGTRSKHINGIKTLPATGGNFAFEFPATDVKIEYTRPDGAKDIGHVSVVAEVPYLVMKTMALGRGKPKDAYDIYCMITEYPDGVQALAEKFRPYVGKSLIQNMKEKLHEKFASVDHAGPQDLVAFLGLTNEEEIALKKQDAYQRVKYLVEQLEM